MLIHVQTITQTTFALVDDSGNITETRVVNAVIPALAQEAFDRAFIDICSAREQLRQDFDKDTG